MKLAITGGSGFVGNYLAKEIHGNYELNLIGRKTSDLGLNFKHNIDDNTSYDDALKGVDVVIHCAARVHILDDAASDPLSEFRAVNTQGTLNLARQAVEAGVKRFIFISTIKVNGESTLLNFPFTGRDEPAPEDPYGISKAEAESGLFNIANETSMEVVIIRPPLVYGEGVKANFASLMNFVNKGFPLPFRSIKKNKRSLVSVYNLVDLIKTCIEHPAAANQVFLASDDQDLSTAEIVSLMAKVQGKRNFALPVPVWCFNIVGKLLNRMNVIDRLTGSLQLDIAHTKNTLEWVPPYSVEQGFKLAAVKLDKNN